ncbi:unnamed protein product [[Candida] boidinii]|nr:unnamed protein product [[Candida] boidinii]
MKSYLSITNELEVDIDRDGGVYNGESTSFNHICTVKPLFKSLNLILGIFILELFESIISLTFDEYFDAFMILQKHSSNCESFRQIDSNNSTCLNDMP